MAKSASRPQRWAAALEEAKQAVEAAAAAWEDVKAKFEALNEIKGEYEEWQGNLPDSLANGALGEKLQAVVDLDFEPEDISDAEGVLDEAENIELPLGFGRD